MTRNRTKSEALRVEHGKAGDFFEVGSVSCDEFCFLPGCLASCRNLYSVAMSHRTSERGDGRIGFLISLALLGTGIFVGVKIIPVRVNAYEFRDFNPP